MGLTVQRIVSFVNFAWFIPMFVFLLKAIGGYKCVELAAVRRRVREIFAEAGDRPVLMCANHLTMIDSMLIAYLLAPLPAYLVHFDRLPWNVPELANFGRRFWLRTMCYLGKSVFVERQGSKESRQLTMDKLEYLLRKGQTVMIFPEGGRSRTGRVDADGAVYGAGLLLQRCPETVLMTIYLRGDGQETFGFFPKRGETFRMRVESSTPTTTMKGLRGARDLTQQIMASLVRMEEAHFADRQ